MNVKQGYLEKNSKNSSCDDSESSNDLFATVEEVTDVETVCNTKSAFNIKNGMVKHRKLTRTPEKEVEEEDEEKKEDLTEIVTVDTIFKSESNFHLKKQSRRKIDEIAPQYFCDMCDKDFTRKSDVIRHSKNKHSNVQQLDSKASCSNEESLDMNKIVSQGDDKLMKRTRRKQKEILAEHFCDVCEKGFVRKYDMLKHRKNKHPGVPKSIDESLRKNADFLEKCKVHNADNKIYYKCDLCDKSFATSYNFLRHHTIHTGVRAYFCHICGKNFRILNGLRRHINEHHYKMRNYACRVCEKKFATAAVRDEHENIHTDNRPFVCDICGKAFRQKASLHTHKIFHFENYRFSCDICGKKFRRASDLKVHGYLHTGHKPHKCELCDAAFRLKQDLKRHQKVHDKLNECVCKECNSTFSQEKYLKIHMKVHRRK